MKQILNGTKSFWYSSGMEGSFDQKIDGDSRIHGESTADSELSLGTVLLIGGASGSGKSSVAKAMARSHQCNWIQVDDLRLALQWSHVQLPTPEATEALYFLDRAPDVWSLPASRLKEAFIATGDALVDAIAIVIGNHIAQNDSAVIEGDGILPSILDHPMLQAYTQSGHLLAVFLEPKSLEELHGNHIQRGRGISNQSDSELHRRAEANWLYSQWLCEEARKRSQLVIASLPFDTLATRVESGLSQLLNPEP